MSSVPDAASLIQDASDPLINRYVAVSSVALILFDTMLSLSDEIKFIWRGKFRLAASLYIMTRYLAILSFILSLVKSHVNLSTPTFNSVLHVMDVSYIFNFVGMLGLLVARAYAISGRSKIFLAVLMFLYSGSNISAGVLVAASERCDVEGPLVKLLSLYVLTRTEALNTAENWALENEIGKIFNLVLESTVIVVTL